MKNTKMPSRVLSGVLACALAFTMNPITAFADDTANTASDSSAAEEAVINEEAVVSEEAVDAPVPPIHTAEVPVATAVDNVVEDAQQPAAISAESASAKEDLEILSGSIALDEAPATMLVHNGLNYQVNADDPTTVALVGISNAPKGTMTIPSQIVTVDGILAVTEIVAGGGSLKI